MTSQGALHHIKGKLLVCVLCEDNSVYKRNEEGMDIQQGQLVLEGFGCNHCTDFSLRKLCSHLALFTRVDNQATGLCGSSPMLAEVANTKQKVMGISDEAGRGAWGQFPSPLLLASLYLCQKRKDVQWLFLLKMRTDSVEINMVSVEKDISKRSEVLNTRS